MAINRYSTSSRFSPKTTDPITKARIADPKKEGKVNPQGTSIITSWPEFRESYRKGELPSDLLTGGYGDVPKDIVSYMKGETDILSERYAEPEYNINPKTQKIATYRSIGDPGFTEGDTYTRDDEGYAGKRSVGFIRYASDDPRNKGMISRRKKSMKSYGLNLKDYIQGDTVGSGLGSGSYSEDELAGLYPDLQVGGDVGMSDFSQSVYRPSKKQIAEEKERQRFEDEFRKEEAAQKDFVKKGVTPLKLRKAELPMGNDYTLVGNVERGEYSDPDKPFVEFIRGGKDKLKGDTAKGNRKARRELFFQNLKQGGNKLKASKQERTYGRFENLGEKRKYRKEEKLAKSTYGRGFEDMTGGELEARKDLLKSRKREQMSPFKRDDEGKITGVNRPKLFKNIAANQEARKEIRDINRAQEYSKLVGGPQSISVSSRVNRGMLSKLKNNPGPQYFTPERMQNFRSSKDNPLNRNSIAGFFK